MFRLREWRKGTNRLANWAEHGGARAICDRCVRTRAKEIEAHNALFYRQSWQSKDPHCAHEWAHPHAARWSCVKCHAEFNWHCGCGGSQYVCPEHYQAMTSGMAKTEGSIYAYLAKHSW